MENEMVMLRERREGKYTVNERRREGAELIKMQIKEIYPLNTTPCNDNNSNERTLKPKFKEILRFLPT